MLQSSTIQHKLPSDKILLRTACLVLFLLRFGVFGDLWTHRERMKNHGGFLSGCIITFRVRMQSTITHAVKNYNNNVGSHVKMRWGKGSSSIVRGLCVRQIGINAVIHRNQIYVSLQRDSRSLFRWSARLGIIMNGVRNTVKSVYRVAIIK